LIIPGKKVIEYKEVFNLLDKENKGVVLTSDFLKIIKIFSHNIAKINQEKLNFEQFIEYMKKRQIKYAKNELKEKNLLRNKRKREKNDLEESTDDITNSDYELSIIPNTSRVKKKIYSLSFKKRNDIKENQNNNISKKKIIKRDKINRYNINKFGKNKVLGLTPKKIKKFIFNRNINNLSYGINSRLNKMPKICIKNKKSFYINNSSKKLLEDLKAKLLNKGIDIKSRNEEIISNNINKELFSLQKIVNDNFYGNELKRNQEQIINNTYNNNFNENISSSNRNNLDNVKFLNSFIFEYKDIQGEKVIKNKIEIPYLIIIQKKSIKFDTIEDEMRLPMGYGEVKSSQNNKEIINVNDKNEIFILKNSLNEFIDFKNVKKNIDKEKEDFYF
jgi:hypothetical protein